MSYKGHVESGRTNLNHNMATEELKSDRNQMHLDFNTSLVSRIQFDKGMEAESSLWNVCTG